MPPSLYEAACAVLDADEQLADVGAPCDARTVRLVRARSILRAWTSGELGSEQAESALRALLHCADA